MRFKPLHLLLVLGIVSVTVYAVASSYFDSGIAFDEGELYIRSNGRGGTDTAITPSAAEFNILDGMTVTSTQINNVVTSATNWVGATSTNNAVTTVTNCGSLNGLSATATQINNAVTTVTNCGSLNGLSATATQINNAVTTCAGAPLLSGLTSVTNINNAVTTVTNCGSLNGLTATATEINNAVTSATNWVGATSTNAAVTSCTGAPLLSGLVTASKINNAVARYAGEWDEDPADYGPNNMKIAVGSVTFTTSTTITYNFPVSLTSFQAIIATADMTSSNTTFLTFVDSTPGNAGTLSAWEPSAADATAAPQACDDTLTVYWTAFGY